MIIFLSVVLALYAIALLLLLIGFGKAMRFHHQRNVVSQFISVVVPVRNEMSNLQRLVDGLCTQSLPAYRFEVIFVDDHSIDGSSEWLRNAIVTSKNFSLLELKNGEGKKKALAKGIAHAKGDIIVTTDADCAHSTNWLHSICESFGNKSNMVIGPVRIKENQSLFSKLQSLEFSSLAATSCATAGLGHPMLCNGANLAFRKSAFEHVRGYDGNEHIPSGDDEFLMRKILKASPGTVHFLNNPEGVVTTSSQKNLRDFFSQRVRWAGKWKFNNFFTQAIAVMVLLVQISFLIAILSFTAALQIPSPALAILLVIKILLEAVLLYSTCSFLGAKWRWGQFLLLQFIYPIYVISVGFSSLWGKYEWKGRSLTHSMQRNP